MTVAEALSEKISIHFITHATGLTPTQIHLQPSRVLTPTEEKHLSNAISRHKKGEPLQHILKNWSFMGFDFITDARALIPRPETELLVEAALKLIKPKMKILDLCTGSGCIAVSLALLAQDTAITAVDISNEALSLAQENAAKHKLTDIKFLQSDLFSALTNQHYDIIISNPPYIPTDVIKTLSPTVRDYEPHLALDGGDDGLDVYKKIIPQSKNYLNQDGTILMEIGPPQAVEILQFEKFTNIKTTKDYANHPRIIQGTL